MGKWQKMACQSEPVEDSRAEALPTMLRQAQHAPHFTFYCRHVELVSTPQSLSHMLSKSPTSPVGCRNKFGMTFELLKPYRIPPVNLQNNSGHIFGTVGS
jgi:hypothetical protein